MYCQYLFTACVESELVTEPVSCMLSHTMLQAIDYTHPNVQNPPPELTVGPGMLLYTYIQHYTLRCSHIHADCLCYVVQRTVHVAECES
jgi:hypothetical protein